MQKPEVPKYAKVGIHLGVLALSETCRRYNRKRDQWFNKSLGVFYAIVVMVEVACIATDLLGGEP